MLNVGCKFSDRNFGSKVSVCFPRGDGYDDYAAALKKILSKHADRLEALLLSGGLEAVFEGQGQRSSIRSSETASCPRIEPETTKSQAERTALNGGAMPEMRFVPWPESGPVTLNMVVKAWDIGKSTFRKRVAEGRIAMPEVIEGRSGSDENVWAAEKITSQLKALGIIRRYEAID